jgi:hypothetical protein
MDRVHPAACPAGHDLAIAGEPAWRACTCPAARDGGHTVWHCIECLRENRPTVAAVDPPCPWMPAAAAR